MIIGSDGFDENDSLETLAKARAEGQARSTELVKRALNQATSLQAQGGVTFTHLWPEEAMATAEIEDALDSIALPTTPLAGLPISIKDNCDVRGKVTQAGSAALGTAPRAVRDATCVARLKAAGAVVVGKTNMSELAFSNIGENSVFGTPRNPHDPSRIVGGSSSGAAVSVAEGSVVAAVGTDTGGSIRGPAALCGLAGFKPSYGRIPTDGIVPLSDTLDSVGPIARSINCCATMDSILAGELWRPLPDIPIQGLVFGVPITTVLDDLEQEVAHAFSAAINFLSRAGATIIEFSWPEINPASWREYFSVIARSEFYSHHACLAEAGGGIADKTAVKIILAGSAYNMRDWREALHFRSRSIREAHDMLMRFHAILMPTVPIVAPVLSHLQDPSNAARVGSLIGRNNEIANFFDCCAATIPCHDSGALPVGLLVQGKNGDDRRILVIAKAIEDGLNAFRRRN